MKTPDDYRISFFNPTTKHARTDRNLAILLVSIWAIAVFGFQIALRMLEKPTAEESLVVFESVWDDVQGGSADLEQNQKFINSCLSVIGKQSVSAEHMNVLKNAYGSVSYSLIPVEQKVKFNKEVNQLKKFVESEVSIMDPSYVKLKESIASKLAPVANIEKETILYELIPIGLTGNIESLTPETKSELHQIMKLYLTHNQSVLTNFKFLGFPFHYFYTAVLLLIIFVGICWFYCFRVDRLNAALGLEDK